MEHPNAIRMRETLDAFMRGDLDTLLERFADDVVWYAPGDTPASGVFRGHDGVRRFLSLVKEGSGGSLHVDVDDILAGDRFVTIFMNVAAERDGRAMAVTVAQFAAVDEDGRWSRCWFLPDRLAEWNGFFAGALSRGDGYGSSSSAGGAPA